VVSEQWLVESGWRAQPGFTEHLTTGHWTLTTFAGLDGFGLDGDVGVKDT
jgi:hypothetical protein